jgi:hypothetical protein
MLDKLGRDQFVIRCGDMTEVYWNDGKRGRSDLVSCMVVMAVKLKGHSGLEQWRRHTCEFLRELFLCIVRTTILGVSA